jgi:hypothetical protein
MEPIISQQAVVSETKRNAFGIIGLPILGMLSGIAVGFLYNLKPELFTFNLVASFLPGLIFSLFILIGLHLFFSLNKKIAGTVIFLIASSVGYFTSYWIVALLSYRLTGLGAFPLAGFIGAMIMLLGLKILLPINIKNILKLSILSGLLALIALLIGHYIIQSGYFRSDEDVRVSARYIAWVVLPSGYFLLHILWNCIMGLALAILYKQRIKK